MFHDSPLSEEIEILKNFDVKTIELLFYYKKDLEEEIKDMDYIKKMDYVSIHAPYAEDVFYETTEDIKKIEEIGQVKGGKRLPKGEKLVEFKTGFPYGARLSSIAIKPL